MALGELGRTGILVLDTCNTFAELRELRGMSFSVGLVFQST